MNQATDDRWEFWIDRGGTFTDCIGVAPDGRWWVHKGLSSDEAPILGIRSILEKQGGLEPGAPLPACRVRLGSTVATNALLERKGSPVVWVATEGLGDLLAIGTQQRPELFRLEIQKATPLHREVIECGGRPDITGTQLDPLDEESLRQQLQATRQRGIRSLAVCLMHACEVSETEERVAAMARELGFEYVVASHEMAQEVGLLSRAETTVADAYLTPLLRQHTEKLAAALPGSGLRFMQSSGGLTRADRFRGPNALLSGPAGGVVAAARVAERAGFDRAIGFDMGGTSTDVSLMVGGEVERSFETEVGGVRVRAPMLRIHTVAAGGGSLCRFDGFRMTVGPESAGSDPGPLCYGLKDSSGEPRGHELSLTDVNLFLGRVQEDRFPFEVSRLPVEKGLAELVERAQAAGVSLDTDGLAAGFVEIANASMAQAIAEVSVARGVDPRDHVLVGFGGAGGQHACGIARRLGIRTILLHPLAGLLSAYGIGVADVSWDGQRDAGQRRLPEHGVPDEIAALFDRLIEEGRRALELEGHHADEMRFELNLDLRYQGSESPLVIGQPAVESESWRMAFEAEHELRFGYARPERGVEIMAVRVRGVVKASVVPPVEVTSETERPDPQPVRQAQVHFEGVGRCPTPVYLREALEPGTRLSGPLLVLEGTGTVVVDPGFELEVDEERVLRLEDQREVSSSSGPGSEVTVDPEKLDPVRLEVLGNRFMSMAEQMGVVLRKTALSTNIKERLDYSCAVFDGEGGLVANAPHIPVHLGAMAATVKAVLDDFESLSPGDVVVTNDPFSGGSHLPDVTVVTPVFRVGSASPDFFVASRGHHADLGGMTPGSMPADSTRLEEEGVLIKPFRLVRSGHFEEERIREVLEGALFPARCPDDNVADLVAMVAANRKGESLLLALVEEQGARSVILTMEQLQAASARKVAHEIEKLPDGVHSFEDQMDDGTPVRVRITVDGPRMEIDFTGTGAAVSHNLNAPPAVVQAALIYVLRSLVDAPIPLNGGCLQPVRLVVPEGSLLDPPPGSAVVGGNVETSQRVVDVLLGALRRAAASQGTMNNVAFGNEAFGYYETIGGGGGGGPDYAGASGVHTHMTNTRITDPEVLELRYPVRLERFSLRRGSGGEGRNPGGDGLIREYRFLEPVTVSLLTQRRLVSPWGLDGGGFGQAGRNRVKRGQGEWEDLPGHCTLSLSIGDRLSIETPGGGGMGDGER